MTTLKILVTGANRGLGYHLTKMGLDKGHIVIAGVRNLDQADQLTQLKERFKDSLHLIKLDVTSEQNVIDISNQLKEKYGSLDVVINNAAVLLEREKFIDDLDIDQVLTSFEVNTIGPMRVIKYLLPLLYAGNNQSIINVSSEAGTILNAFPTNYAYSMSKTALNMFSERLREYLKNKGIQVYAIHPGWMKTDMGGEDAPFDPINTANGIYDIVEEKKKIYSKIAFIDTNGRPMPL
ncbi:SDR family oxidoreductase [Gracilibacillus sp. YIM 98692]|uniref:SDR family oxidoreductase n=1 Tax=Gracilibacillus sp. YIM 98692 TaxID=2663532 RepID=UPI0013D4B960|nr:SDR family oxidoreductase [Gracilibacillus sp. YIM 98692]